MECQVPFLQGKTSAREISSHPTQSVLLCAYMLTLVEVLLRPERVNQAHREHRLWNLLSGPDPSLGQLRQAPLDS